ncbi:MAG: chemotaxis protein CheW [Geminicoccaceae bacterium]|nr:MAG: chemotaxis protein CheW [Geminicoccaceae bacterium]
MSAVVMDPQTRIVDNELVSVWLGKQLVGLPVAQVQDILGPQQITHVPRAAKEIAGVLNLRGRIVTAIDLRARLGMVARDSAIAGMSVVVEHKGELYSLLIDKVGEVLNAPLDRYEQDTSALSADWREVASGVFRLDAQLLVVLDVGRVLQISGITPAGQLDR